MTDIPTTLFDETRCQLGEGALWHPARGELFWFDILGRRLHRRGKHWQFDAHVSAAGWVDKDRMLIASDNALLLFDIETGASETLCPLEADNPRTRSNDGRADPQGGFWIGTMGLAAESGAGAIYRFYRGELRKLFADITISNAICFSPDGGWAYFTDTVTKRIMRQRLADADGWPVGAPELHVDLTGTGHSPDGAVVDSAGTLWNAQWGSGRVAGYDPQGREIGAVAFAAAQTTCPAFGGADLRQMFCTSAADGLSQAELDAAPASGCTFTAPMQLPGQAEHRVLL